MSTLSKGPVCHFGYIANDIGIIVCHPLQPSRSRPGAGRNVRIVRAQAVTRATDLIGSGMTSRYGTMAVISPLYEAILGVTKGRL